MLYNELAPVYKSASLNLQKNNGIFAFAIVENYISWYNAIAIWGCCMKKKTMQKHLPYVMIGILALFIGLALLLGLFASLSIVLVSVLVWRLVAYICDELKSDKSAVKKGQTAVAIGMQRYSDYAKIVMFVLLVQAATYAFAYIAAIRNGIVSGGFFESFERIWLYSGIDAPSYLGIAENWYVTSGDPMYHIVFFPFFPVLIRLFNLIFDNSLLSALVINTLSSVGIGLAAYELALIDHSRKDALRFVKYIFIIPASFFFFAPMTEALFLLLSLLCVYFARRSQYVYAAILGALASFTRSQGVLLMFPVAVIAVNNAVLSYKHSKNKKKLVTDLVKSGLCTLAIATGLVAYLGINYSVWGDAFQFSVFQREHWSQELGFFFETVQMIFDRLKEGFEAATTMVFAQDYSFRLAVALWLPQLLYIFASLFVMLFSVKRMDPAYTVFYIVYFIFSVGATWLLSAPRYLMACMSVPLGITVICKNIKADIAATVLCIVLNSTYLWMYAASSPIF